MSTRAQQGIPPKVEPSSVPSSESAVLHHSLLCVLSCHTHPSESTFGPTMLGPAPHLPGWLLHNSLTIMGQSGTRVWQSPKTNLVN